MMHAHRKQLWRGRRMVICREKRLAPSARRATWRVVGILLLVAILAGFTLLATNLGAGPQVNTLPYELSRTSLQVLGVVIVGSFLGLATFGYQQKHQRAVDERRRVDDRVRAVFEETVNAYNEVKLVRRLLRAETGPKGDPKITRETYTRLLPDLCKQQLAFEDLKRSAPLIQTSLQNGEVITKKPAPATLADTYDVIEDYLNNIVEEYENSRYDMPKRGALPLVDPSKVKLREFVYDTRVFRDSVSNPVRAVLRHLEEH